MCGGAEGAGKAVGNADYKSGDGQWQLSVQTEVFGGSERRVVSADAELRVLLIARNGEILCVHESSRA